MRIELEARLITPMFIGGHAPKRLTPERSSVDAEQLLSAEGLRVPSLRGAMRFWFRALAGQFTDDIARIRAAEMRVLGGISDQRGRNAVTSAVSIQSWPIDQIKVGKFNVRMNRPEGPERWGISPGVRFGLSLHSRHPHLLKVALGCLWMVGTFGGVGARTRRGFGGIQLEEKERSDSLANGIAFTPLMTDIIPQQLRASLNDVQTRKIVGSMAQALRIQSTMASIRYSILTLLEISPNHDEYSNNYSVFGGAHIIWPDTFDGDYLGWGSWEYALEAGRQHVYNAFKGALCLVHLGSPAPFGAKVGIVSGSPRYASPLCLKLISFLQANQPRYALLATMFENNWHDEAGLKKLLTEKQDAGKFRGAANLSLAEYWRQFLDPERTLNGVSITSNGLEAWSVL